MELNEAYKQYERERERENNVQNLYNIKLFVFQPKVCVCVYVCMFLAFICLFSHSLPCMLALIE